jgi:hypothetical protein
MFSLNTTILSTIFGRSAQEFAEIQKCRTNPGNQDVRNLREKIDCRTNFGLLRYFATWNLCAARLTELIMHFRIFLEISVTDHKPRQSQFPKTFLSQIPKLVWFGEFMATNRESHQIPAISDHSLQIGEVSRNFQP